jgi:hypothetical protein
MPSEGRQCRSVVRPLPSVGSHELVVGEIDRAGCQFGLVDIFEPRDRGGTSVGLVGGFARRRPPEVVKSLPVADGKSPGACPRAGSWRADLRCASHSLAPRGQITR